MLYTFPELVSFHNARTNNKILTSFNFGIRCASYEIFDRPSFLSPISKKRVLLLYFPGGASSGKSTFIKQLRLHKGDGFPEVERRKLTLHVYENLADALNILLDNMKHLGIDFDHEQHKVYFDLFVNF